MQRFWTSVFAMVMGLGVAGAAQAGDGFCHRGGDWGRVSGYALKHGVKFSEGYYYKGKQHKHWAEKWWDEHYETYLYFDPYVHRPYYWCEGHGCYYPINYIETVAPNAKGPGPGAIPPPVEVVPEGGAPKKVIVPPVKDGEVDVIPAEEETDAPEAKPQGQDDAQPADKTPVKPVAKAGAVKPPAKVAPELPPAIDDEN